MKENCKVCGKPSEVRYIPYGYFCWRCYKRVVKDPREVLDTFKDHDLSVANEGTEINK